MTRKQIKLMAAPVVGLVASAGSALAQATPPLDLSTAGSEAAGFIPTSAGWALPIFGALVAVGVVIKVFKRVAK